jgi:hypothetical protein
MQNEMIPDDLRNVWQSQGAAVAPPTLEELRRKAGKFTGQIAGRNRREYAVSALLVLYFGYCAWTSPSPMMETGYGLTIAGLLYMMYELYRRTAAAPAPADLGWKSCAAFHRAELERQRDALRGVWKWYLGPLVPGLATISAAGTIAGFKHSTPAGLVTLIFPCLIGLFFWWLGRLNRKAAGHIQKQIDALDVAATAA